MTRSASRGAPCLKPNEYTVTASPRRSCPVANSSRMRWRSCCGSMAVVSTTSMRQLAHAEEQVALALDALLDARAVLAQRDGGGATTCSARSASRRTRPGTGCGTRGRARPVRRSSSVSAAEERSGCARRTPRRCGTRPAGCPGSSAIPPSSNRLPIRLAGRLSTRKYPGPRTRAWPRCGPAPLMPLTMTSSGMSSIGDALARRRLRPRFRRLLRVLAHEASFPLAGAPAAQTA